jgi:hypothetical protein
MYRFARQDGRTGTHYGHPNNERGAQQSCANLKSALQHAKPSGYKGCPTLNSRVVRPQFIVRKGLVQARGDDFL